MMLVLGDNGSMKILRRLSALALAVAVLAVAPIAVRPAVAAPADQEVILDVAPPRLMIFPLGTARVQTVLTNPTDQVQTFALEILMISADGTLVRAYLSDPLNLAAGVEAPATYIVKHSDGAVRAIITPRPWPELGP
jgi:hypothetical protein